MNPYYQPYWDQPNELEHYGVKGMKWSKKRLPQQLKGVPFGQVTVEETANWLKVNKIDAPKFSFWNSETKTLNLPKPELKSSSSLLSKIKTGLNKIKKTLSKIGGKSTKSLNKNTTKTGLSLLQKIKNVKI